MNKLLFIAMMMSAVGCKISLPIGLNEERAPQQPEEIVEPEAPALFGRHTTPARPTLYELTSSEETRRPEKGVVYENDSRRIKVFQACVEVDEKTKEETRYVLAIGGDLIIAVINKRDYVDGEYLLPGKYCYCGPFKYRTAPVVQGVQTEGSKTVRIFVEVSDEEAKELEEKRRAAESAPESE